MFNRKKKPRIVPYDREAMRAILSILSLSWQGEAELALRHYHDTIEDLPTDDVLTHLSRLLQMTLWSAAAAAGKRPDELVNELILAVDDDRTD